MLQVRVKTSSNATVGCQWQDRDNDAAANFLRRWPFQVAIIPSDKHSQVVLDQMQFGKFDMVGRDHPYVAGSATTDTSRAVLHLHHDNGLCGASL